MLIPVCAIFKVIGDFGTYTMLFEIKGSLSGQRFQVNTHHMNGRAVATTNAGKIIVPLSTYNIFLLRYKKS